MHFEVLTEDASGKIAIDYFLSDILGTNGTEHSWKITPYKGIGHLPKNLNREINPSHRVLLNALPKLLRGYGKTFQGYGNLYNYAVIISVDLDNKDATTFKRELDTILSGCAPAPLTIWAIAIEEGEAWLLGDKEAVKAAYPSLKIGILNSYEYDSICGTWEKLADTVYNGGSESLRKAGHWKIGREKCSWAENIAPLVDTTLNKSPSFQTFRKELLSIINPNRHSLTNQISTGE